MDWVLHPVGAMITVTVILWTIAFWASFAGHDQRQSNESTSEIEASSSDENAA